MNKIGEIIRLLRSDWGEPREAFHRGERCPFLLACSFATEPADTLWQLPLTIPDDVRKFWEVARSATLFKDQQYGQWGVQVLEPKEALAESSRQVAARPRDFASSDLVLARFFGDSDLVVLPCNPARADFGSVTIAPPLDLRGAWPLVAESFGDFLDRLVEEQGDKYWEIRN
jgi:hypothetical protein